MNRFKKLCTASLMMLLASAVCAQDNERTVSYPQLFFGAQAGAQATLTDYNNWELFTPTASFTFGSFFTPVVGARLHINGAWNRGGYIDNVEDFRYEYKYMTSDIDLMVNLVTLIGKKDYYPVNVYLIGGLGLNYAWDNNEAFARKDKLILAYDDGRFSHNARIGAQVECEISKHVSLNLEVAQLTTQLGVAYKFAARKGEKAKRPKAEKEQVESAEVWETRQDTIWYDDVVETPKDENGSMTWNVFYDVRESDFKANEQLASIGAFLKDRHDCKVDIKSYADAKTGNPQINMELSKQRMEKAVKALTDAGVPASSITSNYYGDSIQPFAENDKNRVTIILATGLKDVKDRKMVKKFRTKEVRYRVR